MTSNKAVMEGMAEEMVELLRDLMRETLGEDAYEYMIVLDEHQGELEYDNPDGYWMSLNDGLVGLLKKFTRAENLEEPAVDFLVGVIKATFIHGILAERNKETR